jgi:hypothetical protein
MTNVNITVKEKEFNYLLKQYPPVLANKFLPEWYKNQKRYDIHAEVAKGKAVVSRENRIKPAKQCPAIQEYVSYGIVLRAWHDIVVTKYDDNNILVDGLPYNLPDNPEYSALDLHGNVQTEGMDLNNIHYLGTPKLQCPYLFETAKGYGLEFLDPFYHFRKNIKLLPGYVETDKFHEVNFPFEFNVDMKSKKEFSFMVQAGEPLVLVRPYKIKNNKINLTLKNHDKDYVNKMSIQKNLLLASLSNNWNRFKNQY